MIPFTIDEITTCLKDTQTGDTIETEIVRIKRKSFLSKFNERTGWYVNWSKFPSGVEIYALVLKGTMDIQGLIGIEADKNAQAVHIHWACTAPHNNIWENGTKKYSGVGGHLFAIAGNKSMEYGFDGFVYAEAMDAEILEHYQKQYGAELFPFGLTPHPYRFIISEINMKKITEEYSYDDSDEEI
ncbi:MAG: hypothetical protein K6E62_11775 [Lachnospiraceae bacterium]|nr:hypothetical protein [Lachnospiraceae bacterium]